MGKNDIRRGRYSDTLWGSYVGLFQGVIFGTASLFIINEPLINFFIFMGPTITRGIYSYEQSRIDQPYKSKRLMLRIVDVKY